MTEPRVVRYGNCGAVVINLPVNGSDSPLSFYETVILALDDERARTSDASLAADLERAAEWLKEWGVDDLAARLRAHAQKLKGQSNGL